jgi:ribosomal protein S18 acetylase RimI-like enzyme
VSVIREATAADWPSLWAVLEPVFREGDTYSYARDITEEEARHAWMQMPAKTFVSVGNQGEVEGTYYLKPNQPGQGSHVCNCGYVVPKGGRSKGVASAMCEHSQAVAVEMGFRAMQFNCVVSTNEGAVRLWQKLGFAIAGTLPGAFDHPARGYVDAYVMYKHLAEALVTKP